jgi:hypothetical protein
MAGVSVAAHHVAADAPPGRYDNSMGPGTVYDNATGLTWQANAGVATYDWNGATAFCRAPSLPGMGWRLPSMKELQTIVDESRLSPTIDPVYFPNTPAAFFWTSSPDVTDATQAWVVDFKFGGTAGEKVATPYYVRCVH